MASIRPDLKRSEPGGKSEPSPGVPEILESPAKQDAAAKMLETSSPSQQKSPKLALIPLRSAAVSKNIKQQQQQQQPKPLEAKQFPIVLGRTNLSQWWYQSCDCQQYYCRLHCRPVAKNIGSLSKVMIQIDTKGTARIVGKNPHLVNVVTPERGNSNDDGNTGTNDAKDNGSSNGDKQNTEIKENNDTKGEDQNKDDQPIVLRARDILCIGRRDREPWMRFQVVEITGATNAVNSANTNAIDSATKKENTQIDESAARETVDAGEVAQKEASLEAPMQTQPEHVAIHEKTKPQSGAVANTTSSTQQRNAHHDAQLPEWITTTTTMNTTTGKRSRLSSSYPNYGTTDTKEQQHHQAMVATLTKAAAAAGAAADADERNKSKKHYRYNSYYNYYNQSSYEADSNTAQRKRRRHNTSSFAPYHHGVSSHGNKSLIRSAEDLFYNGSSRRGGRLQDTHNDPQIHLVFQDYETSARLIQAGTRKGRSKLRLAKETDNDNTGINHNSMGKNNESPHPTTLQRKHARTDRNFIGKPKEEPTINVATDTNNTATVGNITNGVCEREKPQEQQQSKSMGLLSKNYAAALLEVSTTPSMAPAPAEAGETAMDTMPPPVVLHEDPGFQAKTPR